MNIPHTSDYSIEAYIGGFLSWLWLQINIPSYADFVSTPMMNINSTIAGIGHLLISLLIPLGSFMLINIYKELLKDSDSWVSKMQNKIVFIFSFKWLKNILNKK